MPYIPQEMRKHFDEELNALAAKMRTAVPVSARAGCMNYVITSLIHRVYGGGLSYSDHNEVVGVLGCAKDEWYRRRTAPYEDVKIEENGDV